MTISMQWLNVLVPYLFHLAVGCVLFVLARRTRLAGFGWLFVALGIWPILAGAAFRTVLIVAAQRAGMLGMWFYQTYYFVCALVVGTISAALQIVGSVKLAGALRMPPAQPLCPRCGYNLTGLADDRCPECGMRFTCELRYLTRPA